MSKSDEGTHSRKISIFLAEDDELIARLIIRFLTTAGFSVEHRTNGNAAWEMLAKDFNRFDLLITDHQMPYCTGLQLVIRLRAAGFKAPIIVQSGSVGPTEIEQYQKAGIHKIIAKATREPELVALVRAVTSQSV